MPSENLKEIGQKEVGFSIGNVFQGILAAGSPVVHPLVSQFVSQMSETKANDVQAVAASQIGLLVGYHEIVLAQSRRSFAWALIGAGAGLGFFLVAVAFALWAGDVAKALIPAISGAVVEVVAGVVFYLYGRTTSQLGDFHGRLEMLQRYLLANSICETLQGEAKEKARSELIRQIAQIVERPATAIQKPVTPSSSPAA